MKNTEGCRALRSDGLGGAQLGPPNHRPVSKNCSFINKFKLRFRSYSIIRTQEMALAVQISEIFCVPRPCLPLTNACHVIYCAGKTILIMVNVNTELVSGK